MAGDDGIERHTVAVECPLSRRIRSQAGGNRGGLAVSVEGIDDEQRVDSRYQTVAIRVNEFPGR